ncbi:MAG: hypothetical protein K2G70_06970 [Turicibacter sp.]|nr:hypothetical protein [Turicibacter sp.]
MFVFKVLLLCSFTLFMMLHVRTTVKRTRFISYSKYVGDIKQTVNEWNEDIQEVVKMYDEAGQIVDATAIIYRLRRFTGILFIFYPAISAIIYQTASLKLVAFSLSIAYLIGNYCLEQLLSGSEQERYYVMNYLVDHFIPFLNLALIILMVIYF